MDTFLPVQLYDEKTKIEALFEKGERKNLTVAGGIRLSKVHSSLQRLLSSAQDWVVGWLLEDGGVYKPRSSLATLPPSSFVFPPHSSPTECGPDFIFFLTDETFNDHYSIQYSFSQSSSLFLDLLTTTIQDLIENNEMNLEITKGEEIFIVGSPFGISSPSAFLNTMSKGIVSNLLYDEINKNKVTDDTINFQVDEKRYSLILTDARHLPGVEGGGVFNSHKQLIGLSIPPIRKTSDAIAFNLFIPLLVILEAISKRRVEERMIHHLPINHSPIEEIIKDFQRSLVFIRSGVYFGSGVIITSSGYIITNAHLFAIRKSAVKPLVRVDEKGISRWYRAEVVYISPSTLDVALLKIVSKPIDHSNNNNNNNINNNNNNNNEIENNFPYVNINNKRINEIEEGEEVIAIGHAIFPPSSRLTPSVSGGIISKIIRKEEKVYMIQTDVVIHKGNSGGMLIDRKGNFVGLVSFNSKSSASLITIPSLSFVIPSSLLFPLLRFVLSETDPSLSQIEKEKERVDSIKELEEKEEIIRTVWRFQMDPLPPLPPTRLPVKYLQYLSDNKEKMNGENSSVTKDTPTTTSLPAKL